MFGLSTDSVTKNRHHGMLLNIQTGIATPIMMKITILAFCNMTEHGVLLISMLRLGTLVRQNHQVSDNKRNFFKTKFFNMKFEHEIFNTIFYQEIF